MRCGGWTLFGGALLIGGVITLFTKEIYLGGEYGDGILLPDFARYALGAILIIVGVIFIFWGDSFFVKLGDDMFYKVVSADSPERLTNLAEDLLCQGWILAGGIAFN